jgi:DNA mismatch repair ATPase MutS
MLNSLSAYAFNHPSYCFPELDEGSQRIIAASMAHPLISEYEAVPNDLEMDGKNKLLLVTGSNMSGKSTFLRTTGINLVLAQCGAPVCATKFLFSPMRILSSIRISDSLQEHTSFFMAELKRLKEIITALETHQPALVLIDEVLRGTNSSDKTHGSQALIKKLIRYNCLGLFATHDLSLSELESVYPDAVGNYCFESRIENDELIFDYKVKHGVAMNKNATFLMQKMGIIE